MRGSATTIEVDTPIPELRQLAALELDLDTVKRLYAAAVLHRTKHVGETARILKVHRNTLYDWLPKPSYNRGKR